MKKRRRNIILTVLLAVVMVLALSACGNGGGTDDGSSTPAPAPVPAGSSAPSGSSGAVPENADAGADIEPIELTFAHTGAPGSLLDNQYALLGREIEAASGGKITLNIFGASTLLNQPEFYEGITSGRVDMCDFQASYFSSEITDLDVLTVPGLYKGERQYLDKVNEVLIPPINDVLQDNGIILLGPMGQATMAFMGSKAIVDPATDLQGMKVRVSGKWAGEAVSIWGGAPVNMAIADVPTALERNTIDTVLSDWAVNQIFKLYEMAPIMTMTTLNTPYCGPCMNLDKWNSLSVAQQDAIMAGIDSYAVKTVEEFFATGDAFMSEELEAAGGEIVVASPEVEKFIMEGDWKIVDEQIEPTATEKAKALIAAVRELSLIE